MKKFEFGNFIKTNSWIEKLNPIIKIIGIIILLISIFLIPQNTKMILENNTYFNFSGNFILLYLLSFYLFLTILIVSAKLNFFKILKNIAPIFFFIFLTFFINIFSDSQSNVLVFNQFKLRFNFNLSVINIFISIVFLLFYLFTKKFIKIGFLYFIFILFLNFLAHFYLDYKTFLNYQIILREKNLYQTLFLLLRIINVILLMGILTSTTDLTSLNYGISNLLKPLKIFKLPVTAISIMLSLTFRFIPQTFNEIQKIQKAQAARGADMNEVFFIKKIKYIIALLIPIFILSFKRANELSFALEARGFNLDKKRSSVDVYKVRFYDYFFLFITFLIFGFSIYILIISRY